MSRNVIMTGVAEDVGGLTPEAAWLYVNKHPRPPDSTIPPLSRQPEQIEWATQQFADARITDQCFLSLSCVGRLPWFQLTLPAGPRGLAVYWSQLFAKSALVIGEDVVLELHSGEKWFSMRRRSFEAMTKGITS